MKSFEEIIKRIAQENRSTPENVLHEMQLAIDEAYNHHDACTQPLWDMMTFTGDRPTPEEFMLQIAMMLDEGTVYYSDVRYMAHSGLSF